MSVKAAPKNKELCIEKEEAIDLVGMTKGLIDNMTVQMRRLKGKGYDVAKIEETIKKTEKTLRATKRLLKK